MQSIFNKKGLASVKVLMPVALLLFAFCQTASAQVSVDDIEISPALDITRFAPYKFFADITGSPASVLLELTGINGQTAPGDPMYIDYYVDGTPKGGSLAKNMTYNAITGKWESPNIYPDTLYPESFFAESALTWYNAPTNMVLYRQNYQLLHFANPFTMVGDMSFFIEINASPVAANTSDLEVYLVEKGKTDVFFQSDWRNSPDVELVGTITAADSFHHTHTDYSSHHLVALSANPDGTVGLKNLDIGGDFWVILYTVSPNNARGWNFRYHPSCDDRSRWYTAAQAGWKTAPQNGCPDSHIHVARRDLLVRDGSAAKVTANLSGGGTVDSTESFYFEAPPNLPPNSTIFTSPLVGGVYDGGGTNQITVSWNPSNDPNNDPLLYSVQLLDSNEQVVSTLIADTASTSFVWDISGVGNGTYKLKGIIEEDIPVSPLSTEFFMDGFFTIEKTVPIYSLGTITIASNNIDASLAKAGDRIDLDFTATGPLNNPVVVVYSGGNAVTEPVTVTNTGGNDWRATYTVGVGDTGGVIGFTISASNLDMVYSDTTDLTYVIVDVSAPESVLADPAAGTYDAPQIVTLSSAGADKIKFTTDNSEPACASGTLYTVPIAVNSPTIIKAIACDDAGNQSSVASFAYTFQYLVTFDGNGGGGHSPESINVNHGETTALPTNPTRAGYTFDNWNTESGGGGTVFDTSTAVTANITVYAQWTINSYNLTYYGNGQTGGSAWPAEIHNFGTVAIVKNQNTLVKAGYTFYGWNTAADGSGTIYAVGDNILINGDKDLYAQWLEDAKCTVIFDGNGGTGQTPGSKTVTCGNSLDDEGKILPSNPSREGYGFNVWNTAADGSGADFTTATAISANTTVYAQWIGNNYDISFDAQGGTVAPLTKTVVFGSAVGALPVPVKTGTSFTVWNTEADGGGTNYDAAAIYSTAGNLTLYAQYTGNNYTITFDAQGGMVAPGSMAVTYGSAVGALPVPTKDGYTFTEWNGASNGSGSTYDATTVYTTAADLTLYAQWTGNTYILGFNSRGGTASPAQSVTYMSPVGALPVPTRTGYSFAGWFTESEGGGEQYTATTIYQILDNFLLFADWNINNFTLTYNAGSGGTLTGTTIQVVPYGSDGTAVQAIPARGYTFSRWSDTITTNPRTDLNVTADITVSAIFESNAPVAGGGGAGIINYESSQIITAGEGDAMNSVDGERKDEPQLPSDFNLNDVPSDSPLYDAIKYLFDRGIVSGYPDNTFKPELIINRAEVAKMAVLSSGASPSVKIYNNCFPDVKDEWFAPYVCYAKERGWVHGYLGGEYQGYFRPEAEINRAEIFKIIFNSLAAEMDYEISEDPFIDVSIESWYAVYAKKAGELGLAGDLMNLFRPDEKINRGSAAEYFYRMLSGETS